MGNDQIFSLGGDGTMLVAAGGNKKFKQEQNTQLLLIASGRAKRMIFLEGGSQDRKERAEDIIAQYARLGIPGRRIGGFAVEIG